MQRDIPQCPKCCGKNHSSPASLLRGKQGFDNRIGMESCNFVSLGGVAPAEGDDKRDVLGNRRRDYSPIAFTQAIFREPEASKQITFIGIDPGLIVDQVEMIPVGKEPGEGRVQRREVLLVPGSRRQADIEVALLFGVWECVLLVDRNGEHAWVIMEDVRRTVSLMKIAINDRCRADRTVLQENPETDGDVVEQAEPGCMSLKGMVESTAEMDAQAIGNCLLAGQDRAPGHSAGERYRLGC